MCKKKETHPDLICSYVEIRDVDDSCRWEQAQNMNSDLPEILIIICKKLSSTWNGI